MNEPGLDRRGFLRVATLGALGVAAGCSSEPTVAPPTPTNTSTGSPSTSPSPQRTLAWGRLGAAGPAARRDHTLTANESGTIAFLFGGRTIGKPRADLWAFERSANEWHRLSEIGPAARFGHSAAFIDGHLVVFGGQGGPGAFFNDAWAFDPVRGNWQKLAPPGGRTPAARYGAGGTRVGTSLTISHGFTDSGRFDDTWALASRWTNVTPRNGERPIKRCLHRTTYIESLGRMLLFGGQTDGRPYLGDTWLYDPVKQEWKDVKVRVPPSARNLYALAATPKRAYLFGGAAVAGPSAETWSFDAAGWKPLKPAGTAPPARGGVDGTVVSGPSMLVFGGSDGSRELADLWELTLPA